jgi:hypothetical protein
MKEDLHGRAERLLMESIVEGISPADHKWLARHLDECERCAALSARNDGAVAWIRTLSVQVDPALVAATKQRVRLRADDLHGSGEFLQGLFMVNFLWKNLGRCCQNE